jgi:hypothetical protein
MPLLEKRFEACLLEMLVGAQSFLLTTFLHVTKDTESGSRSLGNAVQKSLPRIHPRSKP